MCGLTKPCGSGWARNQIAPDHGLFLSCSFKPLPEVFVKGYRYGQMKNLIKEEGTFDTTLGFG